MIFIVVKRVTPIDNPVNGYVEGFSDSEDLGIFILSPSAIGFKNVSPQPKMSMLEFIYRNQFDFETEDFFICDK